MLRPILEIYTVWHPWDRAGQTIADQIFEHFHGTLFSGLMGGAVETFSRSEAWEAPQGAPRPIPFEGPSVSAGEQAAELIVVVTVLGMELAREVQDPNSSWRPYLSELVKVEQGNPQRVRIMPVSIDSASRRDTALGQLFGEYQQLATSGDADTAKPGEALCRDLCQGIAQFAGSPEEQRITVFISHTKRSGRQDGPTVGSLIDSVRRAIADTRLAAFFDTRIYRLAPAGLIHYRRRPAVVLF